MKGINHRVITGGIAILAGAHAPGVVGAIIGSTVPDIDIRLGIPHRTWTHWAPVYAISLGILSVTPSSVFPSIPAFRDINFSVKNFLMWILIGALLHLLEDLPTTSGIPLLRPTGDFEPKGTGFLGAIRTGQRWTLDLTRTGGLLEYALSLGLISIFIASFAEGKTVPMLTDVHNAISQIGGFRFHG